MKKIIVLLPAIWILSCNQQGSEKNDDIISSETKDSINPAQTPGSDNFVLTPTDTLLFQLSNEILTAIKEKDFAKLSSYVHPLLGIRFSPYAFIDTLHHQRLLPAELIRLGRQDKRLAWGSYDGSGEPILLDLTKYIGEFVYDADFLVAPQKSVNKILASGNSLNNLKTIYPGADFTEFFFPGFDPKYGGMDWKTLRLVFQTVDKKPRLVAIIHDEWTI